MRILLDHCIDWRLAQRLPAHEVKSAREMGWENLTNGKLLVEAAKHFDVLVTLDQNLKHQHNLIQLPIAVVVLITKSSRLADVSALIPGLEKILMSQPQKTLFEVR